MSAADDQNAAITTPERRNNSGILPSDAGRPAGMGIRRNNSLEARKAANETVSDDFLTLLNLVSGMEMQQQQHSTGESVAITAFRPAAAAAAAATTTTTIVMVQTHHHHHNHQEEPGTDEH
eukprot:g6153.t1 g6153   contig20:935886-936454(-)